MTFPIKKRIDTEQFIDRTAAFYVGEIRNRAMTNEGYQQVGISWLEEWVYHFDRMVALYIGAFCDQWR